METGRRCYRRLFLLVIHVDINHIYTSDFSTSSKLLKSLTQKYPLDTA